MPINDFSTSILSWSPDAVVPQKHAPWRSKTVALKPSTTFPKGSWIAEMADTPGVFGLYVHSGSNGLGTPKGILPRAYVTDSSGNIFGGAQASEELPGVYDLTVPAWTGGAFRQADLNSLDANTLADLLVTYPGAAIVDGSISGTNAIIQF